VLAPWPHRAAASRWRQPGSLAYSRRRQRALAAWASAAGSGLAAWGLGTQAPTRAEMVKNTRPHRDLLRQLGERLPPEAPATAGTHTHLSQRSHNAVTALIPVQIVVGVVFGVRSGLRYPRQLTARSIVGETFSAVTYALAAVWAVQRRRPRIAGRALSAAGSPAGSGRHRLNPSRNRGAALGNPRH
jgi:hypothetical protein